VYIIDRYTYYTLQFLENHVAVRSKRTLQEYVCCVHARVCMGMNVQLDSCPHHQCLSTVGVRYDLYPKLPRRVRVTDFFGSSRHVRVLDADSVVIPQSWL
jgi:glycosylphosphatidylinositol transamidase (GPIT) subunit GPI8